MVTALSLRAGTLGLSMSGQTLSFLGSLLLGALLGALYDVFRISRRTFPLPSVVIAAEDLLYFFLCAFASFCYLMNETDGRIRWFIVAGEILGAVLYHFTLGCVVMAVSDALLTLTRQVLFLLWRLTGAPLWRLGCGLGHFFRRFFIYWADQLKKAMIRRKNGLKRRGKVLYNSYKASHVDKGKVRRK